MARVSVKALADYAASSQDSVMVKLASSQECPCVVLGQILDLSTARGQHEAFGKLSYDPMVTDHVAKLGICRNHKEVLVPFRGCLPPWLFEVINPDTGLVVLLLYETTEQEWGGRAAEWRTSSEGEQRKRTNGSVHCFHAFSAHHLCSSSFFCSPPFPAQ